MVKIEFIQQLAELVKEKDLGEITVADGEEVVTIKGKKCPPPPPMGMPAGVSLVQTPVMQPAGAASAETESDGAAPDGNIVKAPIVGTFYAAASPDKSPFVSVGSTVKKGDVLMIIESMKLMNEVQSEFDGTVTKILVSNGQTVEFDQPIMIIK